MKNASFATNSSRENIHYFKCVTLKFMIKLQYLQNEFMFMIFNVIQIGFDDIFNGISLKIELKMKEKFLDDF